MVLNLIRNLDVLPKVVWKRNGFFKVYNFIWNPPLHLSGVFYHHDTKPKYSTEYRVMVQCLDNSFWHIWSCIVAFGFYMVIDSLLKNSPNLFHSSKRCIIRISVTRVNLWMWKQLQRSIRLHFSHYGWYPYYTFYWTCETKCSTLRLSKSSPVTTKMSVTICDFKRPFDVIRETSNVLPPKWKDKKILFTT